MRGLVSFTVSVVVQCLIVSPTSETFCYLCRHQHHNCFARKSNGSGGRPGTKRLERWVQLNHTGISVRRHSNLKSASMVEGGDKGGDASAAAACCTEEHGNLLVSSRFSENTPGGTRVHARIILASQSPRRAEILDMMGLKKQYVVIPSPLDESALQRELGESNEVVAPTDYARILATQKAKALAVALLNGDKVVLEKISKAGGVALGENSASNSRTVVIGSDTIVDLEGSILEKPLDDADARRMLGRLSGRWHKVHTGVSILSSANNFVEPVSAFTETAEVRFANLSQKDIAAYVATGEPMDKAGAYGIQGVGGQLVESIRGDFFAVMGLPMHKVSLELAAALQKFAGP